MKYWKYFMKLLYFVILDKRKINKIITLPPFTLIECLRNFVIYLLYSVISWKNQIPQVSIFHSFFLACICYY